MKRSFTSHEDVMADMDDQEGCPDWLKSLFTELSQDRNYNRLTPTSSSSLSQDARHATYCSDRCRLGTAPSRITPPTEHKKEDVADATAVIDREIQQLSLEDQEQVFQDVHGTGRPSEEIPSFLSAKLDDFDVELNLIAHKPAYDAALAQCAAYTMDPKLRLQFIRTDQYNPHLAAARFVNWFEMKKDLFGDGVLGRPLTLDDLCPNAMKALASGRVQLLPTRDAAGRAVLAELNIHAAMNDLSAKALLKMMFYLMSCYAEDEETQRTGIVFIYQAHNWKVDLGSEQRELLWQGSRLTLVLPMRVQCLHFVADRDWAVQRFINVLQLGLTRELRHRFRAHFGSPMECKYALVSYGIPVASVPMEEKGLDIDTTYHKQWYELRKKKEAFLKHHRDSNSHPSSPALLSTKNELHNGDITASKKPPPASNDSHPTDTENRNASLTDDAAIRVFEFPTRCDIVSGRGRKFQEHSGNKHMRELIAANFDRYNDATKTDKTAIAEEIVHMIHKRGGHFLKQNTDGSWQELSFAEAKDKVSHAFRKKRELDKKVVKKKKAKV